MAVVILADVPGQTKEGYERTIAVLGEAMREAPGFIMHLGHEVDGGWRVIEVWESSKAAADWFAKAVRPNLPPGVKPQRKYQELHTLIRR
jgi:heme-degrading monooxygenase HmoA